MVRSFQCISSFVASATAAAVFVHPGALESAKQLDFVAGKIADGEQPWANAFRDAKDRWADHQPHGGATSISADSPGDCQDDATASYILALAWKYSGDEAFAEKAVAILNSWSNLQSIIADNDQKKLVAGWIGADFGPAAELLRSYPGWKGEDIASFQAMLKVAFYPLLNEASSWNGNVDLTQIDAMMSMAVFNEDSDEFNSALQRLKARMPSYFYLTSDGALPPPIDGDGGDPQSFWSNPSKWIDGLTQETCRDNGHHAQFALGSALHACEVAWHQGVDVYSTYQERLTSAMELMALQFNSGNMQGTCGGSPTSDRFDTWEIGYSHYHFISGVELPETRKLLEQSIRVQSQRDVLNLVYETLTHADLDMPSAEDADSASGCGSGWTTATWTYYDSYPACCPDNPNYDPKAPTDECDDYSGCKYSGDFAYIDHKSFKWVQSHNIVAFFSTHGDNESYGGKTLRVSAFDQTFEVQVADTCGDDDCDGCCTKNAKKNGGYLVDMEGYTVMNNYGRSLDDMAGGESTICWQMVDAAAEVV